MVDTRFHTIFFAIDDLRESIASVLTDTRETRHSFVATINELVALNASHPPHLIVCRVPDRYLMPVGVALVLICADDDYRPALLAGDDLLVDLLPEHDLGRLPFIVQREQRSLRVNNREARRLRTVIEHSPHGVIEAEINSRRLSWANPAMSAIFGYSLTEINTLLLEDLHPASVHPALIDAFARMSAGEHATLFNVACLRRDGSTFYCNIASSGAFGNGQRLIFLFFTDVTAEVESLQALQINAQRLELALRTANQGLYELDIQSGETTVSAEYASMLGYDPQTFSETSQRWRERLHPADEARVYQAYLDYLAGRIPEYRVEYRSRMRQGGWKWILSVGTIIERDVAGQPTRMLGTHTDISALKRLELHERLRVQLFTKLLGGESLQTLMSTLIEAFELEQPDVRCAIVFFDVTARHTHHVIAPNLPAALVEALEQSARQGRRDLWGDLISMQRIVIPRLSEQAVWASFAPLAQTAGLETLWAEPIPGAGGVAIGAFMVWSARSAEPLEDDLTLLRFVSHLAGPVIEQHVIAERLRLSEERYALAERAVQDGVWDWDITNGVTYLSSQWKALFGFGENELPDNITTFFERIHPEDWPQVTRALDRHFAGLEPFNMEFRMRYRDNNYRWILARGEALRDNEGRVTRMVGALSDITERKQLDERIRENQKLEALGLLTGGLAHDFNNLLGIIIGNLDLSLTDWQGDESTKQLIEASLRAALRGAELTKSLLAVARRQPLAPTTIDVAQVVREFLPLAQVTLGAAIHVRLVEQEAALARADRAGLEAALLNLLINSRDAMPHGGEVTIQIRQRQVGPEDAMLLSILSPGCYIAIDVIDTGTGMPPEVAARAFEPFFTTKERGRGTGLGLAMVYGFAKQSGGTAQIYSAPGIGTTVRLYLPCAEQPAVSEPSPPAPSARREARILVVDDDPDLLRITQTTLINLGYTVLVAVDGQMALSLLQSEAVDLLLTDVVMPGMDGRALAARARQANPALKVLYMSGFAALQSSEQLDAPVLEKPFRASSLEVAIQEALEG